MIELHPNSSYVVCSPKEVHSSARVEEISDDWDDKQVKAYLSVAAHDGVPHASWRARELWRPAHCSTQRCVARREDLPLIGFMKSMNPRVEVRIAPAPFKQLEPMPPMTPEQREHVRTGVIATREEGFKAHNAYVLSVYQDLQRETPNMQMTVALKNLASDVWSAQLRAKVAASRAADRAREPRVAVLAGDWADDEENL